MNVLEAIKEKELLSQPHPATDEQVNSAENILNTTFSDDFRDYLKTYGTIAYLGHELVGISDTEYLNVVNATSEERDFVENIPKAWYVVERLNVDGIVIWQSSSGEIYQTAPNSEPKKIYDSLAYYIDMEE